MPRQMFDVAFREQQWTDRYAPHIAPINRYVDELRQQGRGWAPYVAPVHGGIDARVLSILRDPGPATREGPGSGFLCVENNDGSAALQSELIERAGLTPYDFLPWNAYPWYINRAPRAPELDAGVPSILHLLDLAPSARVVLLQGRHAAHAWQRIVKRNPDLVADRGLAVIETLHPSPQALFVRDPEKRAERASRRVAAFHEVAALLS